MTEPNQPVHLAMDSERPAKQVVRSWWVQLAAERIDEARSSGRPLYLTLPGGGHDIRALLDAGVIERNESGGIADGDRDLVIAIERNAMAATVIRQQFPNITTHPVPVSDFLAGDNAVTYPEGRRRKHARAALVNLDLNGSYSVDEDGSNVELRWITKFAHLHGRSGDAPACSWVLCLTLNASRVDGDAGRVDDQVGFLLEQATHSPVLSALISDLAPWVRAPKYRFSQESDSSRIQRLLMLLVPVKLATLFPSLGWRVTCLRVGLYGHDSEETAPMVTFVIGVDPSATSVSRPHESAAETHHSLGKCAVVVSADGSTSPLIVAVSEAAPPV